LQDPSKKCKINLNFVCVYIKNLYASYGKYNFSIKPYLIYILPLKPELFLCISLCKISYFKKTSALF